MAARATSLSHGSPQTAVDMVLVWRTRENGHPKPLAIPYNSLKASEGTLRVSVYVLVLSSAAGS